MATFDPNSIAKNVIDLLGGRDAAFEKLDGEYHRMMAVWDQDAQSIGRILRAHLFVEYFLTEHIRAKNPNLGSLDAARLTFAQKASLLDSKLVTIKDVLPGIRRLNQVRNRLAHSLHADISADDANVLLGCRVFRAMREEGAKRKSQPPSKEPIDVLEAFALYVGSILHATF
ncbi:hypothetical protein [Roseovarius pacificus]|uniref:hypothetical protein n=1 Tax=Roseovarius pacificus TaxID=337701 RepID=UPI004039AFFC